jgi:hypothetical protein
VEKRRIGEERREEGEETNPKPKLLGIIACLKIANY